MKELQSALSNLISNAVRYTPAGGRITVQWHVLADGRGVFSVRDTGPGVAAEQLQHIFQPFVTGKSDGTGLGLYLVGERVRELHGTVQCFKDRNQTVFEVRLPVFLNNGAA